MIGVDPRLPGNEFDENLDLEAPLRDAGALEEINQLFVPIDSISKGLLKEAQEEATCNQTDPEVFFPENGQPPPAAIRTCKDCAGRAACLLYAIRQKERYGIWGGCSTRKRQKYELNLPDNIKDQKEYVQQIIATIDTYKKPRERTSPNSLKEPIRDTIGDLNDTIDE